MTKRSQVNQTSGRSRARRCGTLTCLTVAAGLTLAAPLAAQDSGGLGKVDDTPIDFVEITPESRQSVERGLAYLASRQDAAGAFSDRPAQGIGISSLALLAFLADGNTPTRGPYAAEVQRGLDYILRNAQQSGLIASDAVGSPMYGHGYATLFLAEVYGMTGDPRVREALRKAVRLIVISQNHEGGWRYNPVPFDADISVTICQVMALRAARNAGIAVPRETIENAIEYVRACQNESDGGFNYQARPQQSSAFPRSAAGVASLYYAGIYEDEGIVRGLDYIMRFRPGGGNANVPHYHYGHYYAVQAMYLAGGKYWAQWFPAVREHLISTQQYDGGWNSEHGPEYGTACSLLVLLQPNRLLPIYQR